MIRQEEEREHKYDPTTHPARLQKILENWTGILAILEEELPPASQLEKLLDAIGAPKTLGELGTDDALLPAIFAATKDIRDKYVLSRLCWDLGILDDIVS
jgi:glycerol-1-phosphate dehydrogenase [NAD(P)+]